VRAQHILKPKLFCRHAGMKGEGLSYPSEFISEKKRCFKGYDTRHTTHDTRHTTHTHHFFLTHITIINGAGPCGCRLISRGRWKT
jgi:hypothetical protein